MLPYQEAQLLSVYFEETALYQAELNAESQKTSQSSTGNDYGMDVDDVTGDGDEIDYYDYLQSQGARP